MSNIAFCSNLPITLPISYLVVRRSTLINLNIIDKDDNPSAQTTYDKVLAKIQAFCNNVERPAIKLYEKDVILPVNPVTVDDCQNIKGLASVKEYSIYATTHYQPVLYTLGSGLLAYEDGFAMLEDVEGNVPKFYYTSGSVDCYTADDFYVNYILDSGSYPPGTGYSTVVFRPDETGGGYFFKLIITASVQLKP